MVGPFRNKVFNRITQRLSPTLAKVAPDFSANQLKNPIFLIGSFRSGTTLLAGLLGMHRDIANWSEANEIFDPQWYPWRPTNSHLPPLEFNPQAFTERWWNDAQTRPHEIKAIFGAYQWLQRKPYFLNKSPYNTFRIPHLLELFPSARFVNIHRDGRAVAYSHAIKLTKEEKLKEWPEPQQSQFAESFDEMLVWMAGFWKEIMDEVARQDAALKLTESGLMLNLTYEKLCADPFSNLEQICQFVGLDSNRFLSQVKQEKVDGRNYKWKEKLDEQVVSRMVAQMEPAFSQNNYT